jgi:hypothetical protein
MTAGTSLHTDVPGCTVRRAGAILLRWGALLGSVWGVSAHGPGILARAV